MSELVGQVVHHPDHGPGQVVRPIRGGRFLMVRFNQGLCWQVRPEELAESIPLSPAAPKPEPGPLGDNSAMQVLEAFRLGVVPFDGPRLTTVGRELEVSLIRRDLGEARRGGSARVFLGDYGAGKTHLLEYIEHLSMEQGFLVSRVVLDDEEVSPSQPKRVYRDLVRNLRYPDEPGARGLGRLLQKASEQTLEGFYRSGGPGYHRYLSPVMAYYRELIGDPAEQALVDELLDWIEGHPGVSNQELERELRRATRIRGHRLYALMDYRPWGHLYAYLVGGLSWLARQVGYQGMVILFDEAEFYALLNSAGREFADVLFGYYAAAALGPERVQFNLDSAPRGGHAVHRAFPPIYTPQQHIYCVFAMTEDPVGVAALRRALGEERLMRLSPLSLEDYQQLCRRVADVYLKAYPDFSLGAEVQNPMGQVVYRGVERGLFSNPRQVLKFVLELLDFSRLRRDQVGDYVKEVMARLRGD